MMRDERADLEDTYWAHMADAEEWAEKAVKAVGDFEASWIEVQAKAALATMCAAQAQAVAARLAVRDDD